MDAQTRICLNAHHDVTNVVKHDDLKNVIIPTLDLFIEQLTRICGPYARNALIIKADENLGTAMGSEMDMRMFLRDGRHIIRNTEFVSPIQQYLKTMVLYIGSRVDAICKDGTTTAMLLTCNLIKELCNKSDDLQLYTLKQIEDTFKTIFDVIVENTKKQSISIESIMDQFKCTENDAAATLAFLQAYTASGCDKEISISIAEFFRRMPKAIWGDKIDHTVSRVEKTGYKCRIQEIKYEYELNAILLTSQYRNSDMRRLVEYDSADVLILPDGILDASLSTTELVNYLLIRLHQDENKTPLVLCTPGGDYCSPRMIESINAKAKEYGVDIPIVAYNIVGKSPLPWIPITLCGKANVPLYQEVTDIKDSVIKNVKVTISTNYASFNNLVPVDSRLDKDSLIHPGMLYPEDYPHHKAAVEIVNSYLFSLKSSHRVEQDEIDLLEAAHADLSVRTRLMLDLGGYYHDQLALQPVIEDSAGSAMAAVKDGVLTNGIFRLINMINDKDYLDHSSVLHNDLLSIIDDAILSTYFAIFGPTSDIAIDNQYLKQLEHLSGNDKSKYKYLDIIKLTKSNYDPTKDYTNSLLEDLDHLVRKEYDVVIDRWNNEGYPPIQTTRMIDELFARLQEIAIKVGMTDMIVVPGAAWAQK